MPNKQTVLTTALLKPYRDKIRARTGWAGNSLNSCERCDHTRLCAVLQRQRKEVLCELTDEEADIPAISEKEDHWLHVTHATLRSSDDPFYALGDFPDETELDEILEKRCQRYVYNSTRE
jgi:hypothetical protein